MMNGFGFILILEFVDFAPDICSAKRRRGFSLKGENTFEQGLVIVLLAAEFKF